MIRQYKRMSRSLVLGTLLRIGVDKKITAVPFNVKWRARKKSIFLLPEVYELNDKFLFRKISYVSLLMIVELIKYFCSLSFLFILVFKYLIASSGVYVNHY